MQMVMATKQQTYLAYIYAMAGCIAERNRVGRTVNQYELCRNQFVIE
jgi:hypothetical protein